jgi:hypothetical protein
MIRSICERFAAISRTAVWRLSMFSVTRTTQQKIIRLAFRIRDILVLVINTYGVSISLVALGKIWKSSGTSTTATTRVVRAYTTCFVMIEVSLIVRGA